MKNKPEQNNTEKPSALSEKDSSNIKKPMYKKPYFWAVLALSIILLSLIIFFAYYFTNQGANRKIIKNGWDEIAKQTEVLNTLSSKVEDQKTFNTYKDQLSKLKSTLKDNKSYSANLRFKGQDVKRYDNFIEDYGLYVNESNKYAEKIIDYNQDDNEKLKDLSLEAKTSADELKKNTKYIVSSMPDSAFEIQNQLTNSSTILLESELNSKIKQLAEEAATAKDIADKQKVENVAGNLLNAFLAGNAPLMRQYMTEDYQKEYDFNQLTVSSRQVVYPASFRIISNTKKDGTNYQVRANVLYKGRDGSGQYIVGQELNVIYSSKWLVNSVRENGSF